MYDQQGRKRFLAERDYEPRTTAWQPDVAAQELEGILKADHYSKGVRYQADVPSTSLRFEPWIDSPVEDQLLFGDTFVAYHADHLTGLVWGRAEHDGHVGFVRLGDLTSDVSEPTHWVRALSTPIYPRPDREAEPVFDICFNARVTVYETYRKDPIFVRIGDNRWMFIGDLQEIGHWPEDPLEFIERLVSVGSYVWGHRDGLRWDCSSIHQAVHLASGRFCFRDADQQENDPGLGECIAFTEDFDGLRRYDGIYFPKHVAIMVSPTMALHAKGEDVRKLIIEPLININEWRKDDCSGGVRTIRRLS